MKLKKICRIESYPNRTIHGHIMECDWSHCYYLDMRYGRKRWFDEDINLIDNPFKGKYNLKNLYIEIENTWKNKYKTGVYVEEGKEEEFDIMFEDEGIFPYNSYRDTNYYEEINNELDKQHMRILL